MLLTILNESAVNSETLPQLDPFGALAIGIIGLIVIFVIVRYLIKRNKE